MLSVSEEAVFSAGCEEPVCALRRFSRTRLTDDIFCVCGKLNNNEKPHIRIWN